MANTPKNKKTPLEITETHTPLADKPKAPTHKRAGKQGGQRPARDKKPQGAPSTPRTEARKSTADQGVAPRSAKAPRPAAPKSTASKSAAPRSAAPKSAAPTGDTAAPRSRGRGQKLRVFSLGGLGEIGKNMTVLEYGSDMVVIDCGVAFPDDDLLGVDLVIPDVTYLERNAHKIRAILLTHGHEDHIGSLPYVLASIAVPVYGTALTLGILRGKLREAKLPYEPELYTVEAGDTVSLGVFRAEFIHVNHSIADACALAIKTPVGTVFHSGDFKLDVSPMDGHLMDLERLSRLGREGVVLMLGESTNAERGGFTPSERTVGSSFDRIFADHRDKRILVATFSSNVHRVQQIMNASVKFGRKVAILGRSMVNVIGAAMELGYISLPEGTLIDLADIRRYRPDQLTLITTGSQGEPMSALYRMAFGEHDRVRLSPQDLVVLSASAIPGNEKFVDNIINALVRQGIRVVSDRADHVHVSGHACAEELKLMLALVRPKFFMPIHGESRHLYAHKAIAEFMGIPASHVFVGDIGRVLEVGPDSASFAGTVPAGSVYVDGTGVGDVGASVLRDRRTLAEGGLIVVVAHISADGDLLTPPEIISRGYVYMKESEELLVGARIAVAGAIARTYGRKHGDLATTKAAVKDELSRYFYTANRRRPMILPLIYRED